MFVFYCSEVECPKGCSYDYLEIAEGVNSSRRHCGDWSDRLKLLRYLSTRPRLELRFLSDYSHHFGGFKARLSIEHAAPECGDDRQQAYNHSCYLFVSYPEVTWHTAREICKGMKADLASVLSANEERFVVTKIRESHEYSTSAIYWLGAKLNKGNDWIWADSSSMVYSAWIRKPVPDQDADEISCLSLQWTSSPSPLLPSGLYWQPQTCDMVGGYVCKKHNQESTMNVNFNATVNDTEGRLTSPLYPLAYSHNLDYWVTLVSPEQTRIVFKFTRLDLEAQAHCLYDYLEVHDSGPHPRRQPHRLCGHHDKEDMDKLRLVSSSNVAKLHFRSDYSVAGGGFALYWKAVDISGCPLQTLTAKEGVITSPNYPHFLLPHLDCSTTILAPDGKRVWLEMTDFDVVAEDAVVEVVLGGGVGRLQPFSRRDLLSDGVYVSVGERMQLILKTGDKPLGKGYRAVYRTEREEEEEQRTLYLTNNSNGHYLHMNYPLNPPQRLAYTDRLIAPVGHSIHLQFHNSAFTLSELEDSLELMGVWCSEDSAIVEVRDPYREANGTTWRLCQHQSRLQLPPLAIESYFNSIAIRQVYAGPYTSHHHPSTLNASISVRPDENYKTKLLRGSSDDLVETCNPNPCLNGGKCANNNGRKTCQCLGHFTGMFCGLTLCELEPCLFGVCELTNVGFRCHCKEGYHGDACDRRHKPCASNPCDSRGECIETNEATFRCRCHAWWEGARCEKRMLHIPYKPLSERMLQEPFWLGLITVTIVLAILGLFWCAKRHFPEKLEKLLAEDDRNRPYLSSSRSASMRDRHLAMYSREVLGVSTGQHHQAGVSGSAGGHPPPRSLLGRLGIRKPSLLGPLASPIHTASRTFSLDDLLKPPPTTPSPRKKRNNSTPTKKTDKKQILQQLVAPASASMSRDNSGEAIALSTNKLHVEVPSANHAETSFSSMGGRALEHSQKLEKKVTFARLLDKVSLEMSSGVDLVTGEEDEGAVSEPDPKSPNSTSSNQGSDSQSSSELQLNSSGEPHRRTGRGGKTASADSILAMFRNFSAVGGLSCAGSSSFPSPSTTPTGSTPRDEVAGSDDSSVTTPSSAAGLADSPPLFTKNTILIPVLDSLSAQKGCANNFLQPPTILLEVPNKCLSPIRELPTPSPSPAITPVMARHNPMHLMPFHNYNVSKLDIKIPSLEKEDDTDDGNNLVIPVVTVQEPSPTKPSPPALFFPGSPPPQRDKFSKSKPLLKDLDKPTSLDLPCPPPLITVTCSMSEMESDTDSPAMKTGLGSTSGMTYLSPFSMCSRGDRTTSESNLSSSGYSSMASPGPSRCGSNNPLCPTDVEDNHHAPRRPSPLLRTPLEAGDHAGGSARPAAPGRRGRSDSETLSDDPHIESNDEGFGTDQLEEKIEEGELKSAKELELFMGGEFPDKPPPPGSVKHCNSFDTGLETYKKKNRVKHCNSVEAGLDSYRVTPPPVRHCGSAGDNLDSPKVCKILLQLPSIVVESSAASDVHCSPVSSRSESPLSDKTVGGVGRFSPMFYGRMTDSDGLYDCASSADCHKAASKKHSGRRRERKRSKSPTAKSHLLLDVPGKNSNDTLTRNQSSRSKPSPKRRARPQPMSSTSSSSAESLNSIRDMSLCIGPDKVTERLTGDWQDKSSRTSCDEPGEDETGDDATTRMLLNKSGDGGMKTQRKISRMRTVGHQIRFLRRLEQSLKKNRERLSSPERPLLEDSVNEGRSAKAQRMMWLRHRGAASDGLLLGPEERSWKGRMSLSTSGHTD